MLFSIEKGRTEGAKGRSKGASGRHKRALREHGGRTWEHQGSTAAKYKVQRHSTGKPELAASDPAIAAWDIDDVLQQCCLAQPAALRFPLIRWLLNQNPPLVLEIIILGFHRSQIMVAGFSIGPPNLQPVVKNARFLSPRECLSLGSLQAGHMHELTNCGGDAGQ